MEGSNSAVVKDQSENPSQAFVQSLAVPAPGVIQDFQSQAGGAGQEVRDVNSLFGTYRKDFANTYDGLKQRSVRFSEEGNQFIGEAANNMEPIKNDVLSTLTDMTPVNTPLQSVIAVYGWASFMLFGSILGSILGAYILYPLIGIFLGKFGAGLLAAIAAPAYGFYYIKKIEQENHEDPQARFGLLALAIGQGILSGFAISELYVSAQPLAFLFPIVICFAYPGAVDLVGANRPLLLAITLGAALSFNFLIGFIGGAFTGTYFCFSVLYTVGCGVVMQILFKNVASVEQRVHLFQVLLLTLFVSTKLVVFGLVGQGQIHKTQVITVIEQ